MGQRNVFIDSKNRNLANKSLETPYLDDDSTAIMVHIEPVKEIRKLILSFLCQALIKLLLSAKTYVLLCPFTWLSEGEGSLMQVLKDRG